MASILPAEDLALARPKKFLKSGAAPREESIDSIKRAAQIPAAAGEAAPAVRPEGSMATNRRIFKTSLNRRPLNKQFRLRPIFNLHFNLRDPLLEK